jgi:hypothetical protein
MKKNLILKLWENLKMEDDLTFLKEIFKTIIICTTVITVVFIFYRLLTYNTCLNLNNCIQMKVVE